MGNLNPLQLRKKIDVGKNVWYEWYSRMYGVMLYYVKLCINIMDHNLDKIIYIYIILHYILKYHRLL